MTQPAAPQSKKARRKMAERGVALKWLVVLAALSVATVLDGVSVRDAMQEIEQATITLPSDRCNPGCSIMMASNQPNDAVIGRLQ